MQNDFAGSRLPASHDFSKRNKLFQFVLIFILTIFTSFVQAAVPVVNTTIAVEKTGSEPFDATTWDGSDLATAGLDQFEDNNVVRMQDSITYRVEVSVNDSAVDNLVATVLLDKKQAWISIPTGCETDSVTPVSSISVDKRTLICNTGPAIEGTTKVVFPAARAIGASYDGTVITLNDDTVSASVTAVGDASATAAANSELITVTANFKVDTVKELKVNALDPITNQPLYNAVNKKGPANEDGMLIEYVIKAKYMKGSMIADGANELAGDFKASYNLIDIYTDDNINNNGAESSNALLYTWGPDGAAGACSLVGDHGPGATVSCTQGALVIDALTPAGVGTDGLNDKNIDIQLTDIDVRDPDADANLFEIAINVWVPNVLDIQTHQTCPPPVGNVCTDFVVNTVGTYNAGTGTFEGFNPVSTEDASNMNLSNYNLAGEPFPNKVDYGLIYTTPGSYSTYQTFFGLFTFAAAKQPEQFAALGETVHLLVNVFDYRLIDGAKTQTCTKIDTPNMEWVGIAPPNSVPADIGYGFNYNNEFNPSFVTFAGAVGTIKGDGSSFNTYLYTDEPNISVAAQRDATCDDDVNGDTLYVIDGIDQATGLATGAPNDWVTDANNLTGGSTSVTRVRQESTYDKAFANAQDITHVKYSMATNYLLKIKTTAAGYGANKYVVNFMTSRKDAGDGIFGAWIDTSTIEAVDGNNAGFALHPNYADRTTIIPSSIAITKHTDPTGIKVVRAADLVDFVIEPEVLGIWNNTITTADVTDTLPANTTYVLGSEMFSTDGGTTWLSYADYVASSPVVTIASPQNTSLVNLVWNFSSVDSGEQLPLIKYTIEVNPNITSGTFVNEAVLTSSIDGNGGASPVSAKYQLNVFPKFGLDVSKRNQQDVYSTNTPFEFNLTYKNFGGEDYSASEFIDIFPFIGDGSGVTSGLNSARTVPTTYAGSIALSKITVTNGETFMATSALSTSIQQDPCHEDNLPLGYTPAIGDTCYNYYVSSTTAPVKAANTFAGGAAAGTGVTNWQACTSLNPVTCGTINPEDITAVRFAVPSIPLGAGGTTVKLEFSPLGNIGGIPDIDANGDVTAVSTGNIYTNNFGGRVPEISLVVISNDVSVTVVSNSIGNHLWFDTNGNGIDDAEPPIPGITINLLDALGNPVYVDPVTGGIVDATTPGAIPYVTITDANGDYLFSNLPDGTYQVSVDATTLPLGLAQTYDADGIATPNVSTIPLVANTDIFGNIISGNDNDTQDFGYQQQAYLGDYVWYDANQDGIQDAGEVGVNGIGVNLYSTADCSGAVTASTTTANGGTPAADGYYEFTPIPVGTYCIEFTGIPANHSISPTGAGTVSTDSNAVVDGADPTIARITNINLTAADPDEDMGLFVSGSVSGLLWCESDTNPNLVYDAADGDLLQSNVTVNLYDDANCNNIIDGTDAASLVTQSTVAGNYSFMNLITGGPGAGNNPPGCYIVEVDTTDPDLGECYNAITAPQLFPTVDAVNPDSPNNDFGHEERLNIGDYVWYDNNQNGLQDAIEPGVNGVTVELYHSLDCSGPVLDTTVTANGGMPATDGWYNFGPLASGDYCIQFSGLAVGWVITSQNQGADDTVDSDADTVTGQIQNITLMHNDFSNDTGVYASIGNIPGQVYCDANLSLTYNAGEEQVGVAVTLLRDSDCDGTGDVTVATVDTDATGSFDFTNLPVGLSPIPPNPAVCYVLNYDLADVDLTGCSQPFLPVTSVVELSTDIPSAPPIEFGNHVGAPMMIPVNKWWALLVLSMMIFMVGRRYNKN